MMSPIACWASNLFRAIAAPTAGRAFGFCPSRTIHSYGPKSSLFASNQSVFLQQNLRFHASSRNFDLMEFFDDQKNWSARDVKSGRSWTKEDLRLKSNSDLHKLWFVLYKERNMLYTMQEECKRAVELFPSPERIEKVEESMANLQAVVDERNKAVKLLELGITGEAPQRTAYSGLGIRRTHVYKEHLMPYWRNANHFKPRFHQENSKTVKDFLSKYWEMKRKDRRKLQKRQTAILCRARQEYPDHPIWEEKDPWELTYQEVYHGKMSD